MPRGLSYAPESKHRLKIELTGRVVGGVPALGRVFVRDGDLDGFVRDGHPHDVLVAAFEHTARHQSRFALVQHLVHNCLRLDLKSKRREKKMRVPGLACQSVAS